MNNVLYNQAVSSLKFKDEDHRRFLTADDKDICFNIVNLSSKS